MLRVVRLVIDNGKSGCRLELVALTSTGLWLLPAMDVAVVIVRVLRIGPSLCNARASAPPIQAEALRNCGGIVRGLQRRA